MSSDLALKYRAGLSAPGRARDRRIAAGAGVPLSRWEAAAYFAVAALLDAYLGLRYHPAILDGLLVNPDSYMRIVRLREILSHHAFVSVVSRDASGAGMELNWSHLIDALVLLLAAPLSPFFGVERAVHLVTLAAGPISIGLLAAAIAWAVAPLSEQRPRWFVPLLIVGAPAINGYAIPGVLHHHIPVAVAVVMMAGHALRGPDLGARAGRAMGIWAAIGIWLTPEGMPFFLAAFGGLGLFWMLNPQTSRPGEAFRAAGTGFLVTTAATLIIDPPYGGYLSAVIDRLSIVYLALSAVVCAIGWALAMLDRLSPPPLWRGIFGGIVGDAGVGLWLAAFPAFLAGTYGIPNAAAARIYVGGISEMQPISTFDDVGTLLMSAAILTAIAMVFAIRRRSFLWGYAVVCGVLMLALAVLHRRFATYPEIAAIGMLPIVLTAIDRQKRLSAPVLTAARLAVLAVFLASPLWPSLGRLTSAQAQPAAPIGCNEGALARLMAPYPGKIVLSDPGDAPALLYFSKVLVVGSLYQRNIDAFMRLRAAWRSPDSDTVPDAVRATKASLALVCTRSGGRRSMLVADLARPTLLDRLIAGTPPPWLAPVEVDRASGYALYRLR